MRVFDGHAPAKRTRAQRSESKPQTAKGWPNGLVQAWGPPILSRWCLAPDAHFPPPLHPVPLKENGNTRCSPQLGMPNSEERRSLAPSQEAVPAVHCGHSQWGLWPLASESLESRTRGHEQPRPLVGIRLLGLGAGGGGEDSRAL